MRWHFHGTIVQMRALITVVYITSYNSVDRKITSYGRKYISSIQWIYKSNISEYLQLRVPRLVWIRIQFTDIQSLKLEFHRKYYYNVNVI